MIALRRSIRDRFPHSLLYNIFRFTTIILAAFLLYQQIFFAFFDAINFREAIDAVAAKNLTTHHGYSAVFFDKNYPLHFSTTSQILLTLPATLMIMIFGNHYWVLSMTAIIMMWLLIITIFIVTYNLFSRDKRWLFYFLNIALAIILLTNPQDHHFYFWHRFSGDITSTLLIILGTVLLLKTGLNCNKIPFIKIFLSSLVLGLAILSKNSALISVIIILCSICCRIIFTKSFTKTEKLKLILTLCFSAFLPIILFLVTEIFYLGFEQFIKTQIQLFDFYKHNFLLAKESVGKINPSHNLKYLFTIFGYSTILIIPTTCYLFYLSCKENNNNNGLLCSKISAILLLCSLSSCLYWILFSSGIFNHYLLITILCLIFALSLLLSNIYYKNIRFSCALYIMFFIALIFASRLDTIKSFILHKPTDTSARSEYELIARTLQDLQKEEVTFIACGNNLELEYILPQSNNFKDCHEATKVWYQLQKTLLVINLNDNETTNLLRANQYFITSKKIPTEVMKRCNQEFLKTKNFVLNWCI